MGCGNVARLMKASLVGFGLALGGVACDSPTEPNRDGPPEQIVELPRALSAVEAEVISASNRFGFDLLAQLTDGDNLFMSPLSAHLALGMALNGARDSTLAATRSTLGFDQSATKTEINRAYTDLLTLLSALDPEVELEIANSVWHEQGFPFNADYLQTVQDAFGAEVGGLDFSSPSALSTINSWVDTNTNGRIKKMLDSISPSEVMFLLNAIYFKGGWRQEFAKDRTYDRDFTRSDGSTKPVKMMVREEGELEVAHNATFQLVDLPYGGGAFRMTIMLPSEGVSLASRLDGLDADTWSSWTSGLHPTEAPVELPRFTMTWERELKDALSAMGMDIAFQAGRANFGDMLADGLNPQAPGTDLHITRVKQKSFVEVNEEGTEAAAATSVGVGVTSAPIPIIVNRPFLFAIRERLSGTVLFLGIVEDPESN